MHYLYRNIDYVYVPEHCLGRRNKEKMHKKWKQTIPLVVMLVIGASVTYAILSIVRPITITGRVKSTPNIQIFSDEACTTPISSWEIPDLARGEYSEKTIYLKDVGDSVIDVHWNRELEYITYVTVTIEGWGISVIKQLAPDEVLPVNMRVTALPASPVDETYGFLISFIGEH